MRMSVQARGFFVADEDGSAAENEEQSLNFVRIWADEVIRQAERVEETRQKVRASYRMQGDEPGIDEYYLEGVCREHWAAEHTLLWAAYQLERWRKRLDRERKVKEREYDKKLQEARNVLEHLESAQFVGGRAVAPPWEPSTKNPKAQDPYRSLRKLGGLDLGIVDNGTFCGIPSADLRARAMDIVSSVEADLAEEVIESLVEMMRGR
jgi:hypothetical protein